MDKKKQFSTKPAREKALQMVAWLEEKKALAPVALDLSSLNAVVEAIINVTATSARHAQGLADYALEMSREAGFEFFGMEGYQSGEWILLDCNDLLINIFQEETRSLYRLEDLWPKSEKLLDKR